MSSAGGFMLQMRQRKVYNYSSTLICCEALDSTFCEDVFVSEENLGSVSKKGISNVLLLIYHK